MGITFITNGNVVGYRLNCSKVDGGTPEVFS
jgi:hypothetical protein